ncbi:hypothetical protein WA026_023143 [Henosepilachna vigintioctopunctata]|uniref:Ribosomal protein eL8/eL30/eS12/Gadd45 domain-containing protein n=1 Tax=Henosepilachna vigintioctopunctata TaxID=420089 RepID=A0AAW1TZQ3_9CUCU
MCIEKFEDKCKMINRSKLGRAVRGVLNLAKVEERLVCGLIPAITCLEKNPEDVLLCLLSQTSPGDATTHIQTVLLQAYCYENYIPVIQVDSDQKLAELCGSEKRKSKTKCLCAIITKCPESPGETSDESCSTTGSLSPTEQILTDFYECTLEEFPRPVVKLPG